jgi:hypothetical protein
MEKNSLMRNNLEWFEQSEFLPFFGESDFGCKKHATAKLGGKNTRIPAPG